MGRECAITGKKTTVGRRIVITGLSKKKGGIGLHVTSASKRKFKPNLQRVKIIDEKGTIKRALVQLKQEKYLVEKVKKKKKNNVYKRTN